MHGAVKFAQLTTIEFLLEKGDLFLLGFFLVLLWNMHLVFFYTDQFRSY